LKRASASADRWISVALVAALAAVVAFDFHEFFTEPIAILSGDSLIHSLPLHRIFSELAHDDGWRFWRPDFAFGFPVYAETPSGNNDIWNGNACPWWN
jgi:hypothetical protein